MNAPSSGLQYSHQRQHWHDGGFSDVVTLRFPAEGLRFSEVDQTERDVKLGEVAYLRSLKAHARGIPEPCILTFARLEQDVAVSELFPGVDAYTEGGERLYSANSLLTHTLRTLLARDWLRYDGGKWSTVVPPSERAWRARADAVLSLLVSQDRLLLAGHLGRAVRTETAFAGFDVRRDLIPVDRLGFAREIFWRGRPRVIFNAAFFLLEHDDFFNHHSALGEAYNLHVRDGVVCRPPLYARGAVLQHADGHWEAERLCMADITIDLPDGSVLVPEGSRQQGIPVTLNPESSADAAVYTRAYGLATHGYPLRCTPVDTDRVEFTVVDTRIVGSGFGGGLEIPQNGLVVSFGSGSSRAGLAFDARLPRVRYAFVRKQHHGIRQGIQAGPMLIQKGQRVLSSTSLADEEFWPTPPGRTELADVGVAPTDYPDDVDRTRAGRIGLGVDNEGRLMVVAVSGTERGTQRLEVDSSGATLVELTELLARAGAVDAINLDGGGSTQLFYVGGLTTTPGNRYGMPGATFERMVPSAGVFL
jgi:hypothetical protein